MMRKEQDAGRLIHAHRKQEIGHDAILNFWAKQSTNKLTIRKIWSKLSSTTKLKL